MATDWSKIVRTDCEVLSRIIAGATIEFGYATREGTDGRTRFAYRITLPDQAEPFVCDDLQSGISGGALEDGLCNLLGFLDAFADGVGYEERTGRESMNGDLFPARMREWAHQNSDAIAAVHFESVEKTFN